MATFSQKAAPVLLVFFLLTVQQALCQDSETEDRRGGSSGWSASASIGPSSWSNLQDFNSDTGEGFDSIGWVLDFGAHRRVTRWDSVDVLLGIDLGLFGTEGDIPGIIEDYTQRGLYLTPSARFRFGDRADKHVDLEVGVGWYEVDIVELFCPSGSICSEFDEPFNSDTIGGYVGVSAGFGSWFTIGLRAHMADFGEISGIGTNSGELAGPIMTLHFGANWGN